MLVTELLDTGDFGSEASRLAGRFRDRHGLSPVHRLGLAAPEVEAAAPVEFELYPGLAHAFLNNYWAPEGRNGYDRMIKFMDEQMK